MGDAGFMIPVSSIMNTSYQNQPGPAVYNYSEQSPLRNSYSYSPASDTDFCIETPPPPPSSCNIVSSTTMPIIANGNYSCLGPDLQPQVQLPFLRIVEQPQSKIRYRYASEKGAHGGMQGESSCSAKKTFPTVKLENAPHKKIYIKASLYTNEDIPKLHVHKLTGKHCHKDNGDCIVDLNEENQAVFQGLGINFTGKKEVNGILSQRIYQEFVEGCATKGFPMSPTDEAQLKQRAEAESKSMKGNLNSVKIRFEAFDGENNLICHPIYSRSVQNQKSSESGELKISRISACSGYCTGDDEVFLLCEKVNKKDIRIRFYEDFEDGNSWEAYGHFNEADVHHQVAIVFRTPPYKDIDIQESVTVNLELYRVKDRERSDPVQFTYKPIEKDLDRVVHKRKKLDCSGDYSATSYATQPSFSGSSTVGVRTPRMPGSFSQGHMSPSYQSRGNARPQESAVLAVEEMPDSDSDDISNLITFPSPSTESSENSTGVSSSTDPFPFTFPADIPNPSALFDEEMPTSTIESSSSLLHGDPMWSRSISLPGEDDDDTANRSLYFSDCASLEYRGTLPQRFEAQGHKDETSDIQTRSVSFRSPEPESTKKSQHLGSPEQKMCRSKISVSPPKIFLCSASDDPVIDHKASKGLRRPADRRIFTSGGSQHQLPADRKERRPTGGDSSRQIFGQMGSPSRIGTLVLHSRGSTETSSDRDVRAIVQNVARALRHFLASGDLKLLLYPMRDLMGVTDEDGDNAVHHIALHEGPEPQFVDASLRVVQHLPRAVINQTNNHYQTPLQLAVAVRKLNVLKWLLACGANPNVQDMQGHSALHLAVLKHHHDCLSVLLRKDIKHKPNLNLLNYKGLSPLHMAVLEGCRNCVQSLCAAGADVNTRNGFAGRTALHLAVEYRTELLTILLVQENVLVDTQDYAGNTALHLACGEDNKDAALELMRKDANPLIENFNKCIDDDDDDEEDEDVEETDIDEVEPRGKTPFDLAKGNEMMQGILAGTVSSLNEEVRTAFGSLDIRTEYTELIANPTAQVRSHSHVDVATSVSLPKESASRRISTDEGSKKESTLACTDSGFISAEIKENDDAMSRLCECLDPPNTEWKKLAQVLCDSKHIDQLCKLESSPTRALLRGREEDQFETLLEIAGLQEFIPVLRNENPVH